MNQFSGVNVGRRRGFTLMEVVIVAALSLVVIVGLASTAVVTTRTNEAGAAIGSVEGKIRAVLDLVVGDVRVNGVSSQFMCSQGSRDAASGDLDGVTWSLSHVVVVPDAAGGSSLSPVACLSVPQLTFRVVGRVVDAGVVFERDTLVSLGGSASDVIEWFVFAREPSPRPVLPVLPAMLEHFMAPGESVGVEWKLRDWAPLGTVVLLNGDAVATDPDGLGSRSVMLVESSDLLLTAVTPSGEVSDAPSLRVEVGSAPVVERFVVVPPERQYFIPGGTFRSSVRVNAGDLVLREGWVEPEGLARLNMLVGVLGSVSVVDREVAVFVNRGFAGNYFSVGVRGKSDGGESFRSFEVVRCPAPVLSLSASPGSFLPPGGEVTLSWSIENVDARRFPGASASLEYRVVRGGVADDWGPVPDVTWDFGSWSEDTRETRISLTIEPASSGSFEFRLSAANCLDDDGNATNEVVLSPVVVVPVEPPPPPPTVGGGACSITFNTPRYGSEEFGPPDVLYGYDPIALDDVIRSQHMEPYETSYRIDRIVESELPSWRTGTTTYYMYVYSIEYSRARRVTGERRTYIGCTVSRTWSTGSPFDDTATDPAPSPTPPPTPTPTPTPEPEPSTVVCPAASTQMLFRDILCYRKDRARNDAGIFLMLFDEMKGNAYMGFDASFDSSDWSLSPLSGYEYKPALSTRNGQSGYLVEMYANYFLPGESTSRFAFGDNCFYTPATGVCNLW